MEKNDKLLFFKYAIPCAETLVKRKNITKELLEKMISEVEKGIVPKEKPGKIFKVAFAMCKIIANKRGKEIDGEVIRQYFWFEHDKIVEERYNLMRDFEPKKCKTYPGIVEKIVGKKAIVRTKIGKNEYLTAFAPDVKKGRFVIAHRDFVVEQISEEKAREIAEKTGKAFE